MRELHSILQSFLNEKHTGVKLKRAAGAGLPPLQNGLGAGDEFRNASKTGG